MSIQVILLLSVQPVGLPEGPDTALAAPYELCPALERGVKTSLP